MSGAIDLLLAWLAGAGVAVWRASWQASVLAALVLAVQLVFGRRIAPRWRHAMWVLVLVRLALPAAPSSRLSVFNLAPRHGDPTPAREPAPPAVTAAATPLLSTHAFAAEMRARAAHFTPAQAGVTAPLAQVPSPIAPDPRPPGLWKGWPQALAAAWAAGVLLLGLRVAWATVRVSRALRRLDRATDESVLNVLRATAAELRVRRAPTLLTGDGLFSPALVGFVRPRLLLPRELLARFDAAELRLVLLHELAHLKRRDVLVSWFATLLTVLHWPNPVAWLVAWRLRLERELATDELVMSRTTSEADRRAYGHTIVKLLETFAREASAARAPRAVPAGGVGILEGRQQMKRRITMIARFASRNRAWTVVAVSLVLGLGLVALTDAAQQPPADAKPADAVPAAARPGDPAQASSASEGGDRVPDYPGQAELAALETRRAELLSSRGEGHPEVTALDQRIGQMRARIDARLTAGPIAADELVTVSIMELAGPGIETVKTSRADRDGNISLPYVGKVKAAGVSSADLEQAVAKAYGDKKLIQDAMVAVSLPGRGESHRLSSKRGPAAGGEMGMGGPPGALPGMAAPDMMEEGMAMTGGGFEGGLMPEGTGLFGGLLGTPVDPTLAAILDRKIPEVTFDGVPLTDVVDFLRDVTSANIFVDWRALEAAGVERNAPVTARLRDVAFKDALAVVLRSVDHALNFTTRNGVILIGAAVVRKPVEMKVGGYDVGDLVADAADLKGGSAALAKVISETVRPEFWRPNGQGTITAFANKVVVTATPEVHQEVEALLAVLRQPAAKQPTTKPGGEPKS